METQPPMLPIKLIVIRHSPHDENWLAESLDLALVGAVFGQDVVLLFMGQGVLSLIPGQHDASGEPLNATTTLETLEIYGIKKLLVTNNDLASLNIRQDALMAGVTVINEAQLPACFSNADHVLMF